MDWNAILNVEPKAIACAIDQHGMLSCFTTAPIFGPSQKWIPTHGGKKVSLGLAQVGADFSPGGSLMVRPGYEDEVRDQQQAHYKGQTLPQGRPKEAMGFSSNTATAAQILEDVGEAEAPAGFRDTDGNPIEPEQAASGVAVPAEAPKSEAPSVPVVSLEEGLEKLQSQIDGCAELLDEYKQVILAIAEQLPKTKRAKIQKEIDSLK